MFGKSKKNDTGMILDVRMECTSLIEVLNREYDLEWDDIEVEDTSVCFQIIDFGFNRYIINKSGEFSFFTGNNLLKKSFKVKPDSCQKMFDKKGIESRLVTRSTRHMYMSYMGIDLNGLSVSMLYLENHLDSDKRICSFPLFDFIKMNNEGYMKYSNLNRDKKEKNNIKDIQCVLGDKWNIDERYVQDHPTVSWEEVCECPYENYNLNNGLVDIRLTFQYSD